MGKSETQCNSKTKVPLTFPLLYSKQTSKTKELRRQCSYFLTQYEPIISLSFPIMTPSSFFSIFSPLSLLPDFIINIWKRTQINLLVFFILETIIGPSLIHYVGTFYCSLILEWCFTRWEWCKSVLALFAWEEAFNIWRGPSNWFCYGNAFPQEIWKK